MPHAALIPVLVDGQGLSRVDRDMPGGWFGLPLFSRYARGAPACAGASS